VDENLVNKEASVQDGKSLGDELGRFFASYGAPDGIQGSESASIDPQIKNLSLLVATKISTTQQGTVLDIGCGKGVILRRLANIEPFRQKPGWIYVGADFEENTQAVLELAVELRLHRRVDAVELKDFYASWVSPEIAPRPLLVVIRNVFHELSIDDTAELLAVLIEQLTGDDLLVVQDLQVFPVAERNNACWNPQFFTKMLERCGFNCTFVEEPSKSGNRWFTVHATRTGSNKLSYAAVKGYVIEERKKQYDRWRELGALAHDDAKLRPPKLALIDFDLQLFALGQQLLSVQSPGVATPTAEDENAIAYATFQKHLFEYDQNNLSVAAMRVERSPHFRDRRNSQDALEQYLRSSQQVVVIQGGSFMGKSVLVREVLSRRAHDRCPVMLDIRQASSVWNLVEQYLAEIGCTFPTDLFTGFLSLRFAGVSAMIRKLVEDIAASTVVVIDHFEQLLDPNNSVGDEEIRQFLDILASPVAAKLIITSRRHPDLGFFPACVVVNAVQPPVGRFPEGKHVENVLDDFIDRTRLSITSYPASLLDAIDRYPYLTVLTAKIIQKEGLSALSDEALLESIRGRLREDLLQRIVTPQARPAVELLAFLRVPIPRVMFESLAPKDSVQAAEDLGLLYAERDRYFGTLLTGASILRGPLADGDEPPEIPADASEATVVSHRHTQISHWYARLYRQADDPRWLRELHFHTLAAGDESLIGQFGATYKAELFAAGNHWFRVRRDYPAALVAFIAAKKFGLDTYELNIRIASCLMRVGRREEAEAEYSRLITLYPQARGLKTSYVDSLLNVRDFNQALAKLNEYGFKESDDPWIAHEFGRSYLGLHQH
jgi:tetratricopeptide (TPR) repeat protein